MNNIFIKQYSRDNDIQVKNNIKKLVFKAFLLRLNLKGLLSRKVVKNPFSIARVPPELIKYECQTSSKTVVYYRGIKPLVEMGLIRDGDWDLKRTRFEERKVYKAIRKRFLQGKRWQDTQYYQSVKERFLSNGSSEWRCRTMEEFKNKRLSYLDNLYHSIKNNGYKTQKQLGRVNVFNEVWIGVSRNGELLFLNNAKHRLSMAKILELDTIPVLVPVWHKKYIDRVKKKHDTADINSGLLFTELLKNL